MSEATVTGSDGTTVVRPRGRPPRITFDEVVDAAGALAPKDLTVQSVADHLGVTRSAIYHYVDSADDLVRLTVQHADPPFGIDDLDDATWQAWLTDFARGCRRWRLGQDELALRAVVTPHELPWLLDLVDHGIAVLVRAGFTADTAAHALHFVAGLIWINTHDEIVARHSEDGRHPQAGDIAAAVRTRRDQLPHLIAGPGVRAFADPSERFEREIGWAIDALAVHLTRQDPSCARPDLCPEPHPRELTS